MATRTLLKIKINQNLPLRFLRKNTSSLTRSVAPIAQPEAPQQLFLNNFAFLSGVTHNIFARQMGTSKSPSMPRGSRKVNDDDDDGDDEDDDDDIDFTSDFDDDDADFTADFDVDDALDLAENYLDDDEKEELKEEAPKKKSSRK